MPYIQLKKERVSDSKKKKKQTYAASRNYNLNMIFRKYESSGLE